MKKCSVMRIALFSVLAFSLPAISLASVGVGVGLGKIDVSENLKPGGIYNLPAVPVLNTGDTPYEYGISVEFLTGQEDDVKLGLRPERSWFNFLPATFHIEPGHVQLSKVTLTLPTKGVKPGRYFAFLEAHPVAKTSTGGTTSVGVAAATKLWFNVAPANFFEGVYYRFISLYLRFRPWDTIALGVLGLAAVIWILSRKLNIQIAVKK